MVVSGGAVVGFAVDASVAGTVSVVVVVLEVVEDVVVVVVSGGGGLGRGVAGDGGGSVSCSGAVSVMNKCY